MLVLLDTNILLRSAQPQHPHSEQATRAISKLIRQGADICFCSQNIAEFWTVATRPVLSNGMGFSCAEALHEVNSIERLFTFLPDVPAVYVEWKKIVSEFKVHGVKVYDARLVAVMTVYGVKSVLTFNDQDFKRYDSISVLNPATAQN